MIATPITPGLLYRVKHLNRILFVRACNAGCAICTVLAMLGDFHA